MGLLDILNSVANSGDAQSAPAQAGTSPMAKALLALVATYAMKNMGGSGAPPTQPGGGGLGGLLGGVLGGALGGGGAAGGGGGQSGGLGDLLGGLLGGAGGGSTLNSGLGGLLEQFQRSGHGDVARSWVGPGPNQTISAGDLANALGTDTLDAVAKQTGMGRADLLAGLSQHLPRFVDQLTPNGRLPTDAEAARMV